MKKKKVKIENHEICPVMGKVFWHTEKTPEEEYGWRIERIEVTRVRLSQHGDQLYLGWENEKHQFRECVEWKLYHSFGQARAVVLHRLIEGQDARIDFFSGMRESDLN